MRCHPGRRRSAPQRQAAGQRLATGRQAAVARARDGTKWRAGQPCRQARRVLSVKQSRRCPTRLREPAGALFWSTVLLVEELFDVGRTLPRGHPSADSAPRPRVNRVRGIQELNCGAGPRVERLRFMGRDEPDLHRRAQPDQHNPGTRRVVKLVSKHQQPAADLVFWLSRPMSERIAAVEALREQASDPPEPSDGESRLQRVPSHSTPEALRIGLSAAMRWPRMGIRATPATSSSGCARQRTTSRACSTL